MLHARLGIVALFLPDEGDRPATKTRQPRHHGLVFAKGAVAGQWREIVQHVLGIIQEVRTARMTRHLHLLPRRQAGIGVGHQRSGAALKPFDLALDIHAGVVLGELLQLDDLALQLCDGPLEFQIVHAQITL